MSLFLDTPAVVSGVIGGLIGLIAGRYTPLPQSLEKFGRRVFGKNARPELTAVNKALAEKLAKQFLTADQAFEMAKARKPGESISVVVDDNNVVYYHLPDGTIAAVTEEEDARLKQRAKEIAQKPFPILSGVASG